MPPDRGAWTRTRPGARGAPTIRTPRATPRPGARAKSRTKARSWNRRSRRRAPRRERGATKGRAEVATRRQTRVARTRVARTRRRANRASPCARTCGESERARRINVAPKSHVVVRRARPKLRRTPARGARVGGFRKSSHAGGRRPHSSRRRVGFVPAPRNVRRSRAHVRAHPSPRCHPRRSGRFRCPLPPPPPPGRRGDTSCSCTAPSSAASTTTGS